MSPRIIEAEQLRALVSYEDLIEPIAQAFALSSAGKAENGQLQMLPLPERERGDVLVKTGTLKGAPVCIVKVAPWFAQNAARGVPQGGFIAVLDSGTGHTLALLDDRHYLSDVRTAAAGALAARLFAPARVEVAGVLGAGVQAYWQVLALHRERPFAELRIWARNDASAKELARRLAARLPDVTLRVEPEPELVVRSVDVLITATGSRDPLVCGEWLRPGQHVTAVGADDPAKCEVDAAALQRSRVFVDGTAATLANGDVHRAIRSGEYSLEELAGEIGHVLAGKLPGRRSREEITIAKFVGIGAQDLMVASAVMARLGLGG